MADREALEQGLRSHPDDTGAWLVYADLLEQQGDARGKVILLHHRLQTETLTPREQTALEGEYAERCRAARWPSDGPWPRMDWRVRFERMFKELSARREIQVIRADLGPPTDPAALEHWKAVAGPAWPDGMSELYAQLSSVRLEYEVTSAEERTTGKIHLPELSSIWNYEALEGLLWFDFLGPEHPFHAIRPIDYFVDEAFAVLYPVPSDRPAQVAYHYCGEELVGTGLSYREWLEFLFRSRGIWYWLKSTLEPRPKNGKPIELAPKIEHMARLFPDFDPQTVVAKGAHEIYG